MGFDEEVEIIKYLASLNSTFYHLPAHSFSHTCKAASQYLLLFLIFIYLQINLIVYRPEDLGKSVNEERARIIIQGDNDVSQEDF